MSVNVMQVQALARDLYAEPAKLGSRIATVDRRIGAQMQQRVKARVRVDTGRLRSRVFIDVWGNAALGHAGVTTFTDVDYATYQEYGTTSITPNPAFNDALTGLTEVYVGLLDAAAGQLL